MTESRERQCDERRLVRDRCAGTRAGNGTPPACGKSNAFSPRVPRWSPSSLWGLSFRSIDLSQIGDYGLLTALPWTYYTALALLTLGFTLSLRAARQGVLAFYVVGLIVIIHGTPTIAYGTLRYAWAWKHVGIVDYIQRHGSVDPSIPSDGVPQLAGVLRPQRPVHGALRFLQCAELCGLGPGVLQSRLSRCPRAAVRSVDDRSSPRVARRLVLLLRQLGRSGLLLTPGVLLLPLSRRRGRVRHVVPADGSADG